MFNSQKINNDPHPWIDPTGRYLTENAYWAGYEREHAPRPGYDNNPNPLLVAFREWREREGVAAHEGADRWLSFCHAWEEFGGYEVWNHPRNVAYAFTFANDAHVGHARKVLERLAATS